jgi:NAD-dependent SIR2 family protein deacetylase
LDAKGRKVDMSEMILLGAGASVEAGIPTSDEMTRKIADMFHNSPEHRVGAKVLDFVIGGLLFKRGMDGENPLACRVNVEELFNAVQLLAERGRLDASPFVGSWHSVVEELDQIAPPEPSLYEIQEAIQECVADQIKEAIPNQDSWFSGGDIDRNIYNTIKSINHGGSVSFGGSTSVSHAIGDYLSDYIRRWTDGLRSTTFQNYRLESELKKLADQRPKPGQGRVFEAVAEQMIRALIDLVWIKKQEETEYLCPLIARVSQQRDAFIATLNYDNTIESAAARLGIACDTGISEWSIKGKVSFSGDGIRLIKLHGSIDWEQELRKGADMMEHLAVNQIDLSEKQKIGYRPAVIFGHRNKLTAEGPYLDFLYKFVQELDASDTLTIIGYSFGDTHINALLARWMNGGADRRLRIADPQYGDIKRSFTKELARIGSDRVSILKLKTRAVLKELYQEGREKEA